MSKDNSNQHHNGECVKLVGSPKKMIDLLVTGEGEQKRVEDIFINQGSKHKQVLTAMLLKRLYKLVQTIEENTGAKFVMQEGYEFSIEKGEVLPILMPVNLGSGTDVEKIMSAISHTPEHEAFAYAIYMQVVEWGIKCSVKSVESIT